MRPILVALCGFGVVLSLAANTAARQNAADSTTVRTIDVGTARPVLRAIEALRERYHVPITYEEPRYVYAQDLQDISYVHKGPVPAGVRLVAPRGGTIHFEYPEVSGKPQEGITVLIRRLVAGYAAQGGPVFDVRERSTAGGPEWNVVAVRARDKWGTFVDQPDILGALVSIPEAQRSASEFVTEILQQVRSVTGCEVRWSSDVGHFETWTEKFSAQGVSARDALVELFSQSHTPIVWDMNHDPESNRFILTFIRTPEPENVFPVSSPPASQPTGPIGPKHMPSGAQTKDSGSAVEMIDRTSGRSLRDVLEELERRYSILITYEEPLYASLDDVEDRTSDLKPPLPKHRLWSLKSRTIHFQYATLNGKPQEDTTVLLRRLLNQYATEGGAVFEVRQRTLPGGATEWNVIPVKAKDYSGKFADQPDVLCTLINLHKGAQTLIHMEDEIQYQLNAAGYQFEVGATPFGGFRIEFGTDHLPAREVLATMIGKEPIVWQLLYDPASAAYWLNVTPAPFVPNGNLPANNPQPYLVARPAPVKATGTKHMPPAPVHHRMTTTWGRMELQSKLAQAGYYSGEPSGQWDEKTAEALKKFQAANNLPVTGKLDPDTIRKLGLDVITPRPQ
jgi:hypothetical protein